MISFIFGNIGINLLTHTLIKDYKTLSYICSAFSLITIFPYLYILESPELYYDKHRSLDLSTTLLTIQRRNEQGRGEMPNFLLGNLFRTFNYGTVLNTATNSDINDMRARRQRKLKAKGTLKENVNNLMISAMLFVNTFMIFVTGKTESDLFPFVSIESNFVIGRIWCIAFLALCISKSSNIRRKPVIIGSSLIFTITGLILFLTSPVVMGKEPSKGVIFLKNVMVIYISKPLSSGLLAVLFGYFYELFSPSLRGKSLSVACLANHLTTAGFLFFIDYLDSEDFDYNFAFFILSPFLLILSFFIKETIHHRRKGEVLETEEYEKVETPRKGGQRLGTDETEYTLIKNRSSSDVGSTSEEKDSEGKESEEKESNEIEDEESIRKLVY